MFKIITIVKAPKKTLLLGGKLAKLGIPEFFYNDITENTISNCKLNGYLKYHLSIVKNQA